MYAYLGQTDRAVLDPENPLQFGEVLFPEWYPDYEYKKHMGLANSIEVVNTHGTQVCDFWAFSAANPSQSERSDVENSAEGG